MTHQRGFVNAFKQVMPLQIRRNNIWENSEAGADEGSDPVRCIRQSVPSAERNAKFLSSPQATGRSIAKNVS
jgi:hypothetical protein